MIVFGSIKRFVVCNSVDKVLFNLNLNRNIHVTNKLNKDINDLKNLLSKMNETSSASNKNDKKTSGKKEFKNYKGSNNELNNNNNTNHKNSKGISKSYHGKKEYKKNGEIINKDKTTKVFNNEKFKKNNNHNKRDPNFNMKKKNKNEEKRNEALIFLESGNDRDKLAAKRIITQSFKENNKGIVQIIKNGGIIEICNVIKAFEGIKLNEQGVIIVDNRIIKEEKDCNELEIGEKMLILKIVDRENAIKQYGDFLNEQVVEKLKLSNSNIINKQNKNKKKEDNNKNEIKIVQIGWNISLNDLMGQKKFEIENHVKRGNDIEIIIDEREYLDKDNLFNNNSSNIHSSNSNDFNDEKMEIYRKRRKELNEIEKTKRNKMISLIEDNLKELEGMPVNNIGVKKGYIDSRIIIKVKGIVNKKDKDNDKEKDKNKKEQKRIEKALKAEKMRLRREEKERLIKENMKELIV